MSSSLRRELDYYGENRYDVGSNRVLSHPPHRLNPFDDPDDFTGDSPRMSFGDETDTSNSVVMSNSRLVQRLPSLGNLIPKALTHKSSNSMEMQPMTPTRDRRRGLSRMKSLLSPRSSSSTKESSLVVKFGF